MASNPICTLCLRTLRLQARKELFLSQRSPSTPSLLISRSRYTAIASSRPFSTTPYLDQEKPTEKPFKKPPEPQTSVPKHQRDAITKFAESVRGRESLKTTTEPYIAYGATEDLFRECNKQCDYIVPLRKQQPPPEEFPKNAAGEDIGESESWWYQRKDAGGLGLDVTFINWAQIMFLHMYMLTVRLRCFPPQHAKIWHQNLLDHFFYAAEDRMVDCHGMTSRSLRNKNLKDLFTQWRGVLLSYDEGLIKGDAVLASAIWRNVFKSSVDADISDLALVTAYMRSQLQRLDATSDETIAAGDVRFGDPKALKKMVEQESAQMKRPVTPQELKEVEILQAEKTT